jgi:hypothetical protein
MLGEPVHIRSQCHHCQARVALEARPDGVRPESEEIMVWVGSRTDGQFPIATSL